MNNNTQIIQVRTTNGALYTIGAPPSETDEQGLIVSLILRMSYDPEGEVGFYYFVLCKPVSGEYANKGVGVSVEIPYEMVDRVWSIVNYEETRAELDRQVNEVTEDDKGNNEGDSLNENQQSGTQETDHLPS